MKKIMLSLLMSTLLFGEVFAADEMEAMDEKVIFSTATGSLMIPKVYLRDASGNTIGVVSAKLIMSKATEPYELQVMELGSVANETDTDEFGCVLPQTWHAAMNHCMVQN
jgi:hypothetical protein